MGQNAAMAHQFSTSYLKDSIEVFRYYKKLGERAIAQCPDEGLFTTLDPESNSIAIIVKHTAGNMRSRWTDFLTTDSEKPDRNRDTEFEAPPATRGARGNVGARLEARLRRSRAAERCRSDPDDNHPHRTAFRDAGHQPPDRPLFLSCGPDCIPGKAFSRPDCGHMASFDGSSRQVRTVHFRRRDRAQIPALDP